MPDRRPPLPQIAERADPADPAPHCPVSESGSYVNKPGSPWENGYCESFNGKLRDCSAGSCFITGRLLVPRLGGKISSPRCSHVCADLLQRAHYMGSWMNSR